MSKSSEDHHSKSLDMVHRSSVKFKTCLVTCKVKSEKSVTKTLHKIWHIRQNILHVDIMANHYVINSEMGMDGLVNCMSLV